MKPDIGITEGNTHAVALELSKLLADEFVLSTKTRNAHWNVEGADFYDKHKFFEGQFGQLDKFIDSIAERIRTLGHFAPGTLQLFLDLTQLTEKRADKNDSIQFVKELLEDHESIIFRLRENIYRVSSEFRDIGTGDFLTGLMENHEKMAWFLRSHLVNLKKPVASLASAKNA